MRRFCVFVDTACSGPVPLWWDERGAPVTYASREEAEAEIAEDRADRLAEVAAGLRTLDEADCSDQFVEELILAGDGLWADSCGRPYQISA